MITHYLADVDQTACGTSAMVGSKNVTASWDAVTCAACLNLGSSAKEAAGRAADAREVTPETVKTMGAGDLVGAIAGALPVLMMADAQGVKAEDDENIAQLIVAAKAAIGELNRRFPAPNTNTEEG